MITSRRQLISIYGLIYFVEGIWHLLQRYSMIGVIFYALFGGAVTGNLFTSLFYLVQLLLVVVAPVLRIISGIKAMELGKGRIIKGLESLLIAIIVIDALSIVISVVGGFGISSISYEIVDILITGYFLSVVKNY